MQELTHIKCFTMLIKETDNPIHPERLQTISPEAVTQQTIVAIHISGCDNSCPPAADRTVRVNVLNTNGHA